MMFVKRVSRLNKKTLNYAQVLQAICGVRHFAWLPRRMENGKYVWLSSYWTYRLGMRSRRGVWGLVVPDFAADNESPYVRHYAQPDDNNVRALIHLLPRPHWKVELVATTRLSAFDVYNVVKNLPPSLRGPIFMERKTGFVGTLDVTLKPEIGRIILEMSRACYENNPRGEEAVDWIVNELSSLGYVFQSTRSLLTEQDIEEQTEQTSSDSITK